MRSASRAIVVARYNEDLSWLNAVAPEWRRYIYSKQADSVSRDFLMLPNIGREAHTYLWHIIENYNNLEDFTVFAQGNPLDHCPDFAARVSNFDADSDFSPLGGELIVFNRLAQPDLDGSGPGKHDRTFADFFEHLLDYPCPPLLICRARAQFVVSRKQVHERSRVFYQKCLQTLTDETKAPSPAWSLQHPLEAHFFERLWHRIFAPAGLPEITFQEQLQVFCGSDVLSVAHEILQHWTKAVSAKSSGEEMVWLAALKRLVQRFDLAQ